MSEIYEHEYEAIWGSDQTPRSALKTFRVYHEETSGNYFYTPDCVGCVWFDTRQEAEEQTGMYDQPVINIWELRDY